MVKKMKKYLKFIICVSLIMGLMAPSYAALSASDGSAFVTKAEFDAALADFNSRLTTFEAGINSKIDSQVTSYLDRNGIWNGKEQTVDWFCCTNAQPTDYANLTTFSGDATSKELATTQGTALWGFECVKSGMYVASGPFAYDAKKSANEYYASQTSGGTVNKVITGCSWDDYQTIWLFLIEVSSSDYSAKFRPTSLKTQNYRASNLCAINFDKNSAIYLGNSGVVVKTEYHWSAANFGGFCFVKKGACYVVGGFADYLQNTSWTSLYWSTSFICCVPKDNTWKGKHQFVSVIY